MNSSLKNNKKSINMPSRIIEVNNTCTKTYTFISNDHSKYCYQYNDTGIVKQLQLYTLTQENTTLNGYRVWGTTFECIENIYKILKESAPIDIKLYVNGLEIFDDALKTNIINNIIIAEYKTSTNITLLPLNKNNYKTIKEEASTKANLTKAINRMSSKINHLSLNECKKLQIALGLSTTN